MEVVYGPVIQWEIALPQNAKGFGMIVTYGLQPLNGNSLTTTDSLSGAIHDFNKTDDEKVNTNPFPIPINHCEIDRETGKAILPNDRQPTSSPVPFSRTDVFHVIYCDLRVPTKHNRESLADLIQSENMKPLRSWDDFNQGTTDECIIIRGDIVKPKLTISID